VEWFSGAERLVAGMVTAGLAAVADSVGAGRRVPNALPQFLILPTCARKHRG